VTAEGAPPMLASRVRGVLRAGLPVSDTAEIDDLLELRGVTARAVEPASRASRVRALDGLLRWQLARFEHPRLAEAARVLFGAARGAGGLTLTERRAKAAAAAGYEVHHFRKRVEPEICDRLAAMLSADADDFAGGTAAPRLGRARRPMRLAADVFAWEAAEHEQLLSMLWSQVYALRADLLATARAASMDGPDHDETCRSARTALWRLALLHRQAAAYRDAYGPRLLGADPTAAPEDLAELAGWHPPLEPAALEQLAVLAERHPDIEGFATALATCAAAAEADAWCAALADPVVQPPRKQELWT
jgi:hypothetical protein